MRYRQLPNGDRVFPARGEPPRMLGYFQDKGDKYVFHPILKPCIFRDAQAKYYQACGCEVTRGICTKFNTIDFSKCVGCTERKNPNAES